MPFRDRTDAGRKLAQALAKYRDEEVVVYALPRGGVVVAAEIARLLKAPLDLIIARKIGHPLSPEYGIGAVTDDGHAVFNEWEAASIEPNLLKREVQQEQEEAHRRRRVYLGEREQEPAEDRVAILVDDGLATGYTMRAAIRSVRDRNPRKIVVAVPVAPGDAVRTLQQEVGEVIALEGTEHFLGAIGIYYEDFTQTTDEEVIQILQGCDPGNSILL